MVRTHYRGKSQSLTDRRSRADQGHARMKVPANSLQRADLAEARAAYRMPQE